MKASKNQAEIYETVLKGGALTDAECSEGVKHFRSMADLLSASGAEFRQAFRAANQAAQCLEGFVAARAERLVATQ